MPSARAGERFERRAAASEAVNLAGPNPDDRASFRPDLEGLRAVAVVLIVLYHAGVAGVSGGYVGVDVFFVLSGYLITGLLIRELRATHSISFAAFYARRARRILPASFLVLAATLVVSAVVLSPIRFSSVTKDVAAAALYVPNIRFAAQTTDYWHPAAISPVLHFWSLGAEEQFYLLWPTFLFAAWRLGARTPRRIAAAVGIAVAGSLLLSLALTPVAPSSAFFLLPTRAWELGLGGLLVLTEGRLRTLTHLASGVAGSLGLGMIGASAVLFSDQTPFPGVAALVPVLGTVLVVASGTPQLGAWPAPLLGWRPMRFVGKISYSLYLWHFPLLVLGAVALAGILPSPALIVLEVTAAVLLAAATYRWVEDPLRRGHLIGTIPRRNLAAAVAVSISVVLISLGTGRLATLRFEPAVALVSSSPGGDPLAGFIPASGPTLDGSLPADLTPPLVNVGASEQAPVPANGLCGLSAAETTSPACVDGDPNSGTTVVLFGDSHAMQWFSALDQTALLRHWRLVTLVKASCPYEDVTVMSGPGVYGECDVWRANSLARIAAERPALVVVSSDHLQQLAPGTLPIEGPLARSAWRDGATRTIARLEYDGAKVAVIADTPELPFNPVDCLSSNSDHILRCAVSRSSVLDLNWHEAEQEVAHSLAATFVDSAAWVCASDPCPLVVGRFLVFRDTNHISWPFSWALASRLAAALPL